MPEQKPWVPNLFPKQLEVFNNYKKFTLISGPRFTGKTLASVAKVLRHLWETPGAYVGVFNKTIRTAKQGGIWLDFLNIVLPEWMGREIQEDGSEVYVPKLFNQYGQPFEYTTMDSKGDYGPKSDSTDRTMYFKVRNMWGGESTLLLFSLDNEAEAEARLKSTRFSGLYFPELSNFKTNKVYSVAMNQLRMFHLREDQHMWLADTNPSDEGPDSWIYKLFYKERLDPNHKYPSVQKDLHLIEIFLDDNPHLTPGRRAEIEQSHSHDEGEFERNVNGIWAKGHGKIGKVFADIFVPSIHLIPDNIAILPGSDTLFTGWDLGDVNSSAGIAARRIITRDGVEKSIWLVIEETSAVGVQIGTTDFVLKFMDQLEDLEKFYGTSLLLQTNYSDDSSLNKYKANADTYDYLLVRDASKGRIELQGVQKPDGSIGARVRLIRHLLKDNRLFVGENCPAFIDMLSNMMRGPDHPIAKESRHKHEFDWFSYIVFSETLSELDETYRPKSTNALISV